MNEVAKDELRRIMRKKRSLIAQKEAHSSSEIIADHILDIIRADNARNLILSFASYNNEPDTDVIFDALKIRCQHVDIAYPRVSDDGVNMEYYIVDSLDELASGYKGIREPVAVMERRIDTDIILSGYDNVYVLVPGLAFDKRGYRAGYGGGFYDRYLKRIEGTYIGICYDFQYMEDEYIRADTYDVRCDYIVTEKRYYTRRDRDGSDSHWKRS